MEQRKRPLLARDTTNTSNALTHAKEIGKESRFMDQTKRQYDPRYYEDSCSGTEAESTSTRPTTELDMLVHSGTVSEQDLDPLPHIVDKKQLCHTQNYTEKRLQPHSAVPRRF